MIERIDAVPTRLREDFARTPAEAIARSRDFNRNRQFDVPNDAGDAVIFSVDIEDAELKVYLSCNKYIRLWVGFDQVNCEILESIDCLNGQNLSNGGKKFIINVGGHEVLWERDLLANEMRGKVLRKIFFTPDQCFLYASNGYSLAVSVLFNTYTRLPFLFWWPSDE